MLLIIKIKFNLDRIDFVFIIHYKPSIKDNLSNLLKLFRHFTHGLSRNKLLQCIL